MNRNIKILLIVVVVLSAAYIIISRKPWNNLKRELSDFAIADTGAITKIFLADKKGNTVLLQKDEQGVWLVDNEYPADKKKVELLKATMHNVRVLAPMNEAAIKNAIVELAARAIKVEFYNKKNKLIKTVYVGGPTPDQTGTFMLIEGSSTPFITHIPGFVGYLTPRFNTFPIKWKDKLVFDIPMDMIKEIQVEYPAKENSSFVIDNSTSNPVVKEWSTQKTIQADPGFLKYYLSSFTNLYFEGFDEDIPQAQADSVRNSQAFCIIRVTTKEGLHKKLQVNLKALDKRTKQQYDELGNEMPHDTEKYLAFIDDQKEMVFIQDYNFGRLFKSLNDFKVRNISASH